MCGFILGAGVVGGIGACLATGALCDNLCAIQFG